MRRMRRRKVREQRIKTVEREMMNAKRLKVCKKLTRERTTTLDIYSWGQDNSVQLRIIYR